LYTQRVSKTATVQNCRLLLSFGAPSGEQELKRHTGWAKLGDTILHFCL